MKSFAFPWTQSLYIVRIKKVYFSICSRFFFDKVDPLITVMVKPSQVHLTPLTCWSKTQFFNTNGENDSLSSFAAGTDLLWRRLPFFFRTAALVDEKFPLLCDNNGPPSTPALHFQVALSESKPQSSSEG